MATLFRSYSSVIAVFCFLSAFLFVPFREWRRWTPLALLTGILPALGLFAVGGPVLGWWQFHDPVLVMGVPVMLVLAWYPVEVVFAHGLDVVGSPRRRLALILAVAFVAVLTYTYLRFHGVWQEKISFREDRVFLFALVFHGLLALALRGRRRERSRSSLPPLV